MYLVGVGVKDLYICCVMRELNGRILYRTHTCGVYCLSYTVEAFPIAHDVCVCMFLVIQVYIHMIHVNISSIYYCVCYHNNHKRMVCSHTSFQPMKLSGRQCRADVSTHVSAQPWSFGTPTLGFTYVELVESIQPLRLNNRLGWALEAVVYARHGYISFFCSRF